MRGSARPSSAGTVTGAAIPEYPKESEVSLAGHRAQFHRDEGRQRRRKAVLGAIGTRFGASSADDVAAEVVATGTGALALRRTANPHQTP